MTDATQDRPRILLVDDEPHLLRGLERALRRTFEVRTATSGPAGLEVLAAEGPFAVVVSDMRMPGMDGATFLGEVRAHAPEAVRLLLTGYADVQAATRAINQGQVFRFLSKPITTPDLVRALRDGVEQHRLVTAERVLLQETLVGCIKTLTDLLALTSPTAFGRAARARRTAGELAGALGLERRWELEAAALLSQIGWVTLPTSTAERVAEGRPLAPDEEAMVARLPRVAHDLLASIPRLEPVRELLRDLSRPASGEDDGPPPALGARLLRVVLDADALEARGLGQEAVLAGLRGRADVYDPDLVEAYATLRGQAAKARVREVRLRDLRPGMVLASDLRARTGLLLVPSGQEVTLSLLERLWNFARRMEVEEPVRVNDLDPAPPPPPVEEREERTLTLRLDLPPERVRPSGPLRRPPRPSSTLRRPPRPSSAQTS